MSIDFLEVDGHDRIVRHEIPRGIPFRLEAGCKDGHWFQDSIQSRNEQPIDIHIPINATGEW